MVSIWSYINRLGTAVIATWSRKHFVFIFSFLRSNAAVFITHNKNNTDIKTLTAPNIHQKLFLVGLGLGSGSKWYRFGIGLGKLAIIFIKWNWVNTLVIVCPHKKCEMFGFGQLRYNLWFWNKMFPILESGFCSF